MRPILPVIPDNSPIPETGSGRSELSRRTFLSASSATLLSCLLVQACGEGATGPGVGVIEPPPTGSTTFSNGVVTIQLGLIPALTAANGHQVLSLSEGGRRADVVVLNVGNSYRAFTSICTHEGCIVTGYSNQRMVCPCHGSEFDLSGQPVAGPAPSPLREFAVALNTTAQTLTITV